jgi:hypothetical protein
MLIPELKFTISEIESGIFHIQFENQRDLCQSMMRLQEFYEGVDPAIKGQYFTLEEFMHHFTKENGEFLYTKIWSGFNVPGNVVIDWVTLFSAHPQGLTAKEHQIFNKLFLIVDSSNPWYLIATANNNPKNIIRHEIAHGRFSINEAYNKACLGLLSEINQDDKLAMINSLRSMAYGSDFVDDEIQAYLSTSSNKEIEFWFGKLKPETKEVINKFKKLYKTKIVK